MDHDKKIGVKPPGAAFIPYGKQTMEEDDIQSVVDVLRSDFLTTGPAVARFEKALAEYCGSKHAIAVSSGTAALHLSMLAAEVGPGDRVLTSPNTFLASANCAAYVGAVPDFVDIDPDTYNISTEEIKKGWTEDVRAVVAVDFAGSPCDFPGIAEVARQGNAIVIEDACHAFGTEFRHQGKLYRCGGHPLAHMTVFSFHPVKAITTGEGGAILTDDDMLAERCRRLRNHGMTRDPQSFVDPENGALPWYYEMQELGFNYRITDIQCALGLTQLKKNDGFIKRRQEIVDLYNDAFSGVSNILTPQAPHNVKPSWHLYVPLIDFKGIGKSRTQVIEELRSFGVGTQVHYIPVHLQPYYRKKYGYGPGKCPVAESLYEKYLSLPLYPTLSNQEVSHIIKSVLRVINGKKTY